MQNTQTYNFIQKSFLLCIILQLNSDGKFHPKKSLCQPFDPCGVSVQQSQNQGGFSGTAMLPGAATFCLQCVSSLGRQKGQWDISQMASSVTH